MQRQARMHVPLISLLCGLSGCGYIGNTLPPALNRPELVRDLSAVQRGQNIVIQFTIPTSTTEGIPLTRAKDRDIELRIGPAPIPWNTEAWEHTSDRISVSQQKPIPSVVVPASKYFGKTVDIAVSVRGPSGRTMGWSMFIIMSVIPALGTPERVIAENAPDAVLLRWTSGAPEFRVFRKLPSEPSWTQVGTSNSPAYSDTTIRYGNTYQYQIQGIAKAGEAYAESELSEITTFKPEDHFGPAIPAGLSAVPGTRTIELVWSRNTERDFASYSIYRDGSKIADGVTAPSYSDRAVRAQVKYAYQVSAVDASGNESQKSPVAEAVIP
jgi:hypothetical protein